MTAFRLTANMAPDEHRRLMAREGEAGFFYSRDDDAGGEGGGSASGAAPREVGAGRSGERLLCAAGVLGGWEVEFWGEGGPFRRWMWG